MQVLIVFVGPCFAFTLKNDRISKDKHLDFLIWREVRELLYFGSDNLADGSPSCGNDTQRRLEQTRAFRVRSVRCIFEVFHRAMHDLGGVCEVLVSVVRGNDFDAFVTTDVTNRLQKPREPD